MIGLEICQMKAFLSWPVQAGAALKYVVKLHCTAASASAILSQCTAGVFHWLALTLQVPCLALLMSPCHCSQMMV
jgi:hypothetical protein